MTILTRSEVIVHTSLLYERLGNRQEKISNFVYFVKYICFPNFLRNLMFASLIQEIQTERHLKGNLVAMITEIQIG